MLRVGWLRKLFGNRGEAVAVAYLQRLGYRIVSRQMRNRCGEIDVTALDGDCLVFVEVKTRGSDVKGLPVEAVTPGKQRQLVRTALAWLKAQGLLDRRCRFDVVAVTWRPNAEPAIDHFRNAFEAPPADSLYG